MIASKKCFKFIHDHRTTLLSRSVGKFNSSVILEVIKDADNSATKARGISIVEMMTRTSAQEAIKSVNKALDTYPKWYHKKLKNSSTRKGGFILAELETVRSILVTYQSDLTRQSSHNMFASRKETGSSPRKNDTNFMIIIQQPGRMAQEIQTDKVSKRYSRVDKVMAKLQSMGSDL